MIRFTSVFTDTPSIYKKAIGFSLATKTFFSSDNRVLVCGKSNVESLATAIETLLKWKRFDIDGSCLTRQIPRYATRRLQPKSYILLTNHKHDTASDTTACNPLASALGKSCVRGDV